VFPFLRITLSGLAKSAKELLDNLRFPFAKPVGGAFDHIVRLNVSTEGRYTEVGASVWSNAPSEGISAIRLRQLRRGFVAIRHTSSLGVWLGWCACS
jgi:hypothetical protein